LSSIPHQTPACTRRGPRSGVRGPGSPRARKDDRRPLACSSRSSSLPRRSGHAPRSGKVLPGIACRFRASARMLLAPPAERLMPAPEGAVDGETIPNPTYSLAFRVLDPGGGFDGGSGAERAIPQKSPLMNAIDRPRSSSLLDLPPCCGRARPRLPQSRLTPLAIGGPRPRHVNWASRQRPRGLGIFAPRARDSTAQRRTSGGHVPSARQRIPG
jgi:hypothetical protein